MSDPFSRYWRTFLVFVASCSAPTASLSRLASSQSAHGLCPLFVSEHRWAWERGQPPVGLEPEQRQWPAPAAAAIPRRPRAGDRGRHGVPQRHAAGVAEAASLLSASSAAACQRRGARWESCGRAGPLPPCLHTAYAIKILHSAHWKGAIGDTTRERTFTELRTAATRGPADSGPTATLLNTTRGMVHNQSHAPRMHMRSKSLTKPIVDTDAGR